MNHNAIHVLVVPQGIQAVQEAVQIDITSFCDRQVHFQKDEPNQNSSTSKRMQPPTHTISKVWSPKIAPETGSPINKPTPEVESVLPILLPSFQSRHNALNRAAEKPQEDRDGNERGLRLDADPRAGDNARQQTRGNEDVHVTDLVCQQRRTNPSWYRRRNHSNEHVERQICAYASAHGVRFNVEEGNVLPKEYKEHRTQPFHKRWVSKRIYIH